MVTGTASVPPVITQSHYNPVTRQFTLTWTSVSGALYSVRESPRLNSPSWTILQKQHSIGRKHHDATVTMPAAGQGSCKSFSSEKIRMAVS